MQRVQYRVLPTRQLRRAQETLLPSEGDDGEQQSSAPGHAESTAGAVDLRGVRHQVRLHGQSGRSSGVLLSQEARASGTSHAVLKVQGNGPV